MKQFLAVVLTACGLTLTAQAQTFDWGITAGMNYSKVKVNGHKEAGYSYSSDNNGIATDNIPLHTLNALTNDVSRSQKLALLDGKHFEAICIKSCGNLGFLSHRDFENGIYIHAAVTNNTPLVEGQRWHVTVGARVNKKKGSWCYCALTAKLLSQGSSVAHQYKDIAAPENRTATVKNLKGIFLTHCHDKLQEVVVQIVSLRKTEQQFLLCAVHEFVAVLIVSVG